MSIETENLTPLFSKMSDEDLLESYGYYCCESGLQYDPYREDDPFERLIEERKQELMRRLAANKKEC